MDKAETLEILKSVYTPAGAGLFSLVPLVGARVPILLLSYFVSTSVLARIGGLAGAFWSLLKGEYVQKSRELATT